MEDDRDSFISKYIKQVCYEEVDVKPKAIGIRHKIKGYPGIHKWIKRRKPLPDPLVCEECKLPKKLDLANISGEYKRDIDDYRWLCRRCHLSIDAMKKLNRLKTLEG